MTAAEWAAAKVKAWAPVIAELRGSSLGRQLLKPGFEDALRQAFEAEFALGSPPEREK